jgi:hypothetical protein
MIAWDLLPIKFEFSKDFIPSRTAIVWDFDFRISNLFGICILELEILKAIIGCRSGSVCG